MATCLISIQARDNIDNTEIEQLMGNYKQIILYLFTLKEILAQKCPFGIAQTNSNGYIDYNVSVLHQDEGGIG